MPPRNGRPEHIVAMFGAPTSGKTTFLAALSIALTRQGHQWKVVGTDDASTKKLITMTTELGDHTFPPATEGIDRFHWMLMGRVTHFTGRRKSNATRREETVRIGLDFVDAQGEILADRTWHAFRDELIDNLVRSRGIIFFFDPVSESDRGNAYEHTFGVVAQMAQKMAESVSSDGWLPHYVAVCISKFDDARVYATAEKLNLLMSDPNDPYGFPRVDDDDARELFAHLCKVSRSGTADLVLNTLEQHFRPDRIKYFVSSAVGFYIDQSSGIYDPEDYQNLLPDPAKPEKMRIRGAIHPINVVEPMIWLGSQLMSNPGA
jgi:hypothetical protein